MPGLRQCDRSESCRNHRVSCTAVRACSKLKATLEFGPGMVGCAAVHCLMSVVWWKQCCGPAADTVNTAHTRPSQRQQISKADRVRSAGLCSVLPNHSSVSPWTHHPQQAYLSHCYPCLQEYFLGSGGVFGLLQALVGEVLPGSGRCVAVGNALLQGPVVFHFPQYIIGRIKERALDGDQAVMQLLVDLYR